MEEAQSPFAAEWNELELETQHQIGRLTKDGNQKYIRSTFQESGALFFGPYIPIPKGRYQLLAYIESKPSPLEGLVRIEIETVETGILSTTDILTNSIPNGGHEYSVMFSFDIDQTGFEIRVSSNGLTGVGLRLPIQLNCY